MRDANRGKFIFSYFNRVYVNSEDKPKTEAIPSN
jgi:hypothetical protein